MILPGPWDIPRSPILTSKQTSSYCSSVNSIGSQIIFFPHKRNVVNFTSNQFTTESFSRQPPFLSKREIIWKTLFPDSCKMPFQFGFCAIPSSGRQKNFSVSIKGQFQIFSRYWIYFKIFSSLGNLLQKKIVAYKIQTKNFYL